MSEITTNIPAGWYPTGDGMQRYWDGSAWTEHIAPYAAVPAVQHQSHGPMTGSQLNVNRETFYNRQQTGHSLILHLLFGWVAFYIPTIYFATSPNHYFHA